MSRASKRPVAVFLCAVAFLVAGVTAALRPPFVQARGLEQNTAEIQEGRALFATYCASCHGATGVGNGPASLAMRRRPTDLTGLAMANGNMFPAARVGRIIDGREVEAHGDRDMPVWGDAFKATVPGRSDEAVRKRIASILAFLASIQGHRA